MGPIDRLAWLLVVIETPNIRAAGRDAAIAVAWYTNLHTGEARPSVATIAAHMRADSRTAQRGIRDLEGAGLLVVEHPAGRACCTYRPINPGKSARVQPRGICQGSDEPTLANPSTNPGKSVHQPWQIRPSTPVNLPPEQGMNKDKNKDMNRDEPRAKPSPSSDDGMRGDEADSVGPTFLLKSGVGWRCSRGLLDTLTAAYPDRDLAGEMAKAAAWCETHPTKRKTATGMPKFLFSWLGKASANRDASVATERPSAETLAYLAEIEQEIASGR